MGTVISDSHCYQTLICTQVQKHFVKKWGRVGLEEHAHWSNKKFENKIVGQYSLCMLQLVRGSIFAIIQAVDWLHSTPVRLFLVVCSFFNLKSLTLQCAVHITIHLEDISQLYMHQSQITYSCCIFLPGNWCFIISSFLWQHLDLYNRRLLHKAQDNFAQN